MQITFSPSGNREKDYVFETAVVGGAVSKNYFPAVEKGIAESVKTGLLAGYPVVGLKAVLTDGAEHPVDSSENAFKMAAVMAYKEAYLTASGRRRNFLYRSRCSGCRAGRLYGKASLHYGRLWYICLRICKIRTCAAECSGEVVRRISEKQRIKVESVLDKAVEYDKIFLFRSKYLNI